MTDPLPRLLRKERHGLPANLSKAVAGVMLSDGIKAAVEHQLLGLVVNLSEDVQPELSVDLLRITSYEVGQRWLAELLHQEAWKHIIDCPGISLGLLAVPFNSIFQVAIFILPEMNWMLWWP